MLRFLLLVVLFALGCASTPRTPDSAPLNYLFERGADGYACFRIPAVVTTPEGALLAFAEGRRAGCSDTGDIDLVLRRSEDGGATWGPLQVVWDSGPNTSGNPAPVVDRHTGEVFLLSTWNLGVDREPEIIDQTSQDTRRVYVLSSTDDGRTWSEPREITADVKQPDWTWYATGPGSGIQLEKGPYRGRLMVACDHIEAGTKHYYSHVIYSDDHGRTWRLGGSTPQHQVNESEVAELSDGRLLLNMRNYAPDEKHRKVATSIDGGRTWSAIRSDTTLIEPICQAGLERYRFATPEAPGVLLFTNPASKTAREKMTLRASFDEGRTWPVALRLHDGFAAYSDPVVLPDGSVGVLFEAGPTTEDRYAGIVFRTIDPAAFLKKDR